MRSVTESLYIEAAPGDVYDLIADVSSMGRFSPEATGAVGAAPRMGVGDTFWGTNRRGPWIWMTQCRVTAADRGRIFSFDVGIGPLPISTWSYEIQPSGTGCEVTETWIDRRTGVRGAVMRLGGQVVIPGPRDAHNRRNMRTTLLALRETAEGRGSGEDREGSAPQDHEGSAPE